MKVGIFGGSFDPIHEGHVNLAKYVLEHTDLDEVWLMVSPLNPLKPQGYVATNEQRLKMARLAVEGIPGIRVSDFEFHLPIPSYTYNTLTELKKSYPNIDFRLIIGGDNWANFDHWRNPEEIISEFGVIVYPRPGESLSDTRHSSRFAHNSSDILILDDAPQMPVSSTQIRNYFHRDPTLNVFNSGHQILKDNSSVINHHSSLTGTLNPNVLNYISSYHLYR